MFDGGWRDDAEGGAAAAAAVDVERVLARLGWLRAGLGVAPSGVEVAASSHRDEAVVFPRFSGRDGLGVIMPQRVVLRVAGSRSRRG